MSGFSRVLRACAGAAAALALLSEPVLAAESAAQPTVAEKRGGGWWGGNDKWDGSDDKEDSPDAAKPADHDHDHETGSEEDRGDIGTKWGNEGNGDWSDLAGFAANTAGDGFWVLSKSGRVTALQGAPDLGAPPSGRTYVAMAGHPRRTGYWVLDSRGRVSAFGAAEHRGNARFGRAIGMAVQASGRGYWIASRGGKVAAFGAAKPYGGLRRGVEVDRIVAREDGADGYQLHVVDTNRWVPFPNDWSRPDRNRDRDRDDRASRQERERREARERQQRQERRERRERREREEARDSEPRRPAPSGFTITNRRTEGGVRVATVGGITVAVSLADNLQGLLRAAKRDGASLGGWGYRSTARQIELRRAHCGTTRYAIYSMPSSSCSPPTARPGYSMHEKGLAVDFYKKGRSGQAISIGGTREFRWLKRKASRFGFYNLPSEPWHWSTNGH